MTLMKDLIDIPEKVQRGDFVLNLATGLADEAIDQTLAQYVVTPQLAKAFDDALGFIKSTVVSNQNRQKGTYLHGSFGSGKSHFMAVLNLLLRGNIKARAINELAPVITKNDDWLKTKNILLVPYHMIGAPSIEAGILGGYAKHIKTLHPESPVPGFYLSNKLFKDAKHLRAQIGDDKFFEALNSGNKSNDSDAGWGEVATGWDAVSFDKAVNDQSNHQDKTKLVSDLVNTIFGAMADMANTEHGGYVTFDEGLRIMTEHAKALGYDAIILFLDELILWLASHLANQEFITNNIQKVVKLVESSEPRELPIVSFIARQRDLREFVGDQYTGSEKDILSDSLKYWDGRFHTITLEDRNLPVIAQRRLLNPISESAKQQIAAAFDSMDAKMREEVNNILLTNQGDRDMFRSLYPFSPALVQALVALSSALQRERTALKVMLMLLVEQRETLELGSIIPVGDLYDVIATEAEPFSEVMRKHFENAKTLFSRKLIPLLEAEHNVVFATLPEVPDSDPAKRAFNNDMRLLKTLLLSALVPEVECFKQLSALKLAALNHGTIKSPIPGLESKLVINKCRKWAGQVGEIKVSDDVNPVISIQLSGVDTESILEQANQYDSDGARRKLVKDMVFEAFGIRDDNQIFLNHSLTWRGTQRSVEVLLCNIREISDSTTFEARGDDWKIIVDWPFDSGDHSPADDRARIQEYQDRGGSSRTLCWLPLFFSQAAQRDLGVLVKLEYVLKSDDMLFTFSKHLSQVDRAQARILLENQRSQLRQRVKDYLMGAYGASEPLPGSLDDSYHLDSQIISLESGFTPRLPVGTSLGKAFEQLIGQALNFQYPDHPEFEADVKVTDLGKVFIELRRAIHATNGRIDVDNSLRSLMRTIAQPLGLGEMHERHFIFKPDWPQHLTRELAKDEQAGTAITVTRLRAAMDKPKPKGLPEHIQNFLIMVFAEQGQYAYSLHGNDYDVNLKDIPDNLVLIKQDLADPDEWKLGNDNASAIFGASVSPLRTANNQNELQKQVLAKVQAYSTDCESLVIALRECLQKLNQTTECHRFKNATLAVNFLQSLKGKEGADLVKLLAGIEPVTNLLALSKSIMTAASVTQSAKDNNWQLLETVWSSHDAPAKAIKQRISVAMAADELVTSLGAALKQAQKDATDILSSRIAPADPTTISSPPQKALSQKIIKDDQRSALTPVQAKTLFAEILNTLSDDCVLDVSYRISSTAVNEGEK